MGKPQLQSLPSAGQRLADIEAEWLIAQLADESEHWRARAVAFEEVITELAAEVDAYRLAYLRDAWRPDISAELLEGSGFSADEPPDSRAAALILVSGITSCAFLALLGYVMYRLFAG